jgi:hypothetical protein
VEAEQSKGEAREATQKENPIFVKSDESNLSHSQQESDGGNNSGDVDVGSAGGARDVCRVKYVIHAPPHLR